jgi:hypothetical protein
MTDNKVNISFKICFAHRKFARVVHDETKKGGETGEYVICPP